MKLFNLLVLSIVSIMLNIGVVHAQQAETKPAPQSLAMLENRVEEVRAHIEKNRQQYRFEKLLSLVGMATSIPVSLLSFYMVDAKDKGFWLVTGSLYGAAAIFALYHFITAYWFDRILEGEIAPLMEKIEQQKGALDTPDNFSVDSDHW